MVRVIDIRRCRTDFEHFCESCCTINVPRLGYVPLELFSHQKRLIRDLNEHRLVIGVKRRMEGFTTVSVVWSIWKCMFNDGRYDMIVNHNIHMAERTMDLMADIINAMPFYVRPRIRRQRSGREMTFLDTNSTITSCIFKQGHGRNIDHLFIDEAAWVGNDVWRSLGPLANEGSCHILSTPRENNNTWFEEMYNAADNGRNNFHIFRKLWPQTTKIDWKTEGF
jgi:hypothetical protein